MKSVAPPLYFAVLVLILFADVLFGDGQTVLGAPGTDMAVQFIPWRQFGFDQLRQGNLALWNPHIFGGAPYFGGFQSALLYPINWLHLVLPLGTAINWGIAIHVALAGYFTFLWCRHGRSVSVVGSMFAGTMFMFSGTYFLHLYAGHLPHLCAMVWAPAIFLAIDRWMSDRKFGWCLLGMAAIAMQVFAGHPQYVYYTALAAGMYVLLNLLRTERRIGACLGFAAMYIGGAMLSAIQLLTGAQAAGESWRSGGMPIAIAAQHSLPPENLLTFLSPRVFGDINTVPYFGRWLLWEMCLFAGVSGIVLALYGATRCDKRARRFSGALIVLLLILALGENTPFFEILYKHLPGYGSFRVTAKFSFLVVLMLSSLAGMGFDRLTTSESRPRRLAMMSAIGAAIIGVVALIVWRSPDPDGVWGRFVGYIAAAQQNPVASLMSENPAGLARAATSTASALAWATATLLLSSAILWLAGASRNIREEASDQENYLKIATGLASSRRFGFAPYLLVALCLVELLLFSRANRPTMPTALSYPDAWAKRVADNAGDYRVLHQGDVYPNLGMARGSTALTAGNTDDVWGYDPGVPKRYTQLMAVTQGIKPDDGHQFVRFGEFPRGVFEMVRCRYVFQMDGKDTVLELPRPMSRLELIDRCEVLPNRDDALRALIDPSFDPRRVVILETTPSPMPQPSTTPGAVRLIRAGTDELEIEADLPSPKILLITDNFSSGWRAAPLPGSSQSHYDVLPANHTLRAIPLAAGRHHLLLEYSPLAFRIGKWMTLAAIACFAGSLIALMTSHFKLRTIREHHLSSLVDVCDRVAS